jgi:hypothetical protein
MQYYGAFYRSALYPILERINAYLMRWSQHKYKRLRGRKKAQDQWNTVVRLRPRFFAQWTWTTSVPPLENGPSAGDPQSVKQAAPV